ncbi:hypothetical protein ACROYT_G029580 [Oculina patagonica]
MSTNIDRSLDDIIKDQRKLKRKTQKLKTQQAQKKGAQQRQGKKQTKGANQNQKRRIAGKQGGQSVQQRQGTQGRKKAGRQGGQQAQQRQGTQGRRRAQGTQGQRKAIGGKRQGRIGGGNQNFKKNTTGNKGRFGGAKVTANRLKNKQGSLQKSKQIISKAKQIQQNNRPKNRLNRQTQQRDARQNIINIRRGMQGQLKGNRQNKAQQNSRNLGTPKLQRRNRRGIQSPQLTVSINNPRVRITRTPQWQQVTNQLNNQNNRRRWRGKGRGNPSTMGPTEDLRISVPNNLHRPAPLKPLMYSNYDLPVNPPAPGRTFTTLNERFSSLPQTGRVRTIVID